MRSKLPADVAISLYLDADKKFQRNRSKQEKLNDVEERSRRFVRPKPPAAIAISLSDILTQSKSFNELEETQRRRKREADDL